ncbi:glycoside hydrolase family 2 protein [Atractiella rhizophila]|nr:glycoside hydrolase family 2 protein [Atractiella rhizophila]
MWSYLIPSLLSFSSWVSANNTSTTNVLGYTIPTPGGDTYSVKEPPLTTNWTYSLGTNPWDQYPRPQLKRHRNASSLHDVKNPPFWKRLENAVMVPSCLESGISGLQGENLFYSWLSTRFNVSDSWKGQNIILNFGAVDYEATVFVNGNYAGFHRGGYFRFALDITGYIKYERENELLVFVHDPTDSGDHVIPIGKQSLREWRDDRQPHHIFYRPCSGIWQEVFIEPVSANYITRLDLAASMDGTLNATVHTSWSTPKPVQISVHAKEATDVIASFNGTTDKPFTFRVQNFELWSPSNPNLHNITVTFGDDVVTSYTGFRTFARGEVQGVTRSLLNGEPIFMFGTLDQGFWPDGLYLPPNYEAMVYDLQVLKSLGFNMLRKHIKVENDLFYEACGKKYWVKKLQTDKEQIKWGLLSFKESVFFKKLTINNSSEQTDMPSLRPLQEYTTSDCVTHTYLPNEEQQKEFDRQLDLLVETHKSFPSIGVWIIYNEGWGQNGFNKPPYPEIRLTERVRQLDPTRLISATSGWFDHDQYWPAGQSSDFSDNHHYANPQCGTPFYSTQSRPFNPSRIGFQGEFGGVGHNLSLANLWKVQKAINTINQTYELDATIDAWNYRAHRLLDELREQVDLYSCAGGIWTQTSDVEGEVNGLLTYDRRILRTDINQWKADIQALYDTAANRADGDSTSTRRFLAKRDSYYGQQEKNYAHDLHKRWAEEKAIRNWAEPNFDEAVAI